MEEVKREFEIKRVPKKRLMPSENVMPSQEVVTSGVETSAKVKKVKKVKRPPTPPPPTTSKIVQEIEPDMKVVEEKPVIKVKRIPKTGTRQQVWDGIRESTKGGLKKNDLVLNKYGKIVSKQKHDSGIKFAAKFATKRNPSVQVG